jgi:DNA-binding XRE family transcriptional regulator
MDLRTYLFMNKIKLEKFAETVGCSYTHMMQIKNFKRIPSLILAKSIARETGNKVTVKSLMRKPDEFVQEEMKF